MSTVAPMSAINAQHIGAASTIDISTTVTPLSTPVPVGAAAAAAGRAPAQRWLLTVLMRRWDMLAGCKARRAAFET